MSKFYSKKPLGFSEKVEVSTVFMECEKKLLLLQRAPHKLLPDQWAIPGGKVEKGESPLEALVREIGEELQLFPHPKILKYKESFYVKHPIVEYRLHLFQWSLESIPQIRMNPGEHQAFLWQPIDRFHEISLIDGQLEAFHFVYGNEK